MDIFPTNILENLIVIKSASADLPADFTGGVVNIVTKDIPSEKRIGVSLSAGFNPEMHLNNNYVSDPGSNTDFLGFDTGTGNCLLVRTWKYRLPHLPIMNRLDRKSTRLNSSH